MVGQHNGEAQFLDKTKLAPEINDKQIFIEMGLSVLHGMIKAVGGQIQVPIKQIPKKIGWDFKIKNGVAIITAIEPEQVGKGPAIVAAPAGLADAVLRERGK